jgi:hypothetical protein
MVNTLEYGNIQVIKRCMAEETFEHLWNCTAHRITIQAIIERLKLRIIHDVKHLYPSTSVPHLKVKLNQLTCLTFNNYNQINIGLLGRGIIPFEFIKTITSIGCSLSQARNIIFENLNILFFQFYDLIWVPRCQQLYFIEKQLGILPIHKKRGNQKILISNLTFPVIRYLDTKQTNTPSCDEDLWHNWVVYSCRAGQPWQDF